VIIEEYYNIHAANQGIYVLIINFLMGNQVEVKKKSKVKQENEEEKEDAYYLIFADCINGKKRKDTSAGQDTNDIITKELGDQIKYFGVYDGHGDKGREASNFFRFEVRKNLVNDKKKIQRFGNKIQVENYFKSLYKGIQRKFEKKTSEFELSGTCSIAILILDYRLFSINVGDSRAVMGSRKDKRITALEVSIDHKPIRDDENKRITEKGGEVIEKGGVYRVFRKNDEIPGLAVSRTIGDIVAHECGVSYEPEIIEKEIDPDIDQFVVICSDGVWDSMSSIEVVGFIFDKMDKMKTNKHLIVKMLTEEARHRWELLNMYKQKAINELNQSKDSESGTKSKENSGLGDIDDISAIIHFFNND
jgi:serine/threonine protein phosphatase PrpC